MSTRWSVNITPAERAARIVVGALGAVGGVVLLVGTSSIVVVVLAVLLVLAGLDLVVTEQPGTARSTPGWATFPHR